MTTLQDMFARTAPSPHQHQQARSRMLRPLLAACSLFGAAMFASWTLGPARGRLPNSQDSERDSTFAAYHDSPEDVDPLFHTTACANPRAGAVLRGVDLVGYFSLQAGEPAMEGKEEHVVVYGGYRFWFSSAGNKAMFEEQPGRFIPKWGGFCAWGISEEDVWTRYTLGPPTNPDSWLVTADGELFLFRSDWNKEEFVVDIPGYTEAGNAKWDTWFGAGIMSSERHSPLDTDCFCNDDVEASDSLAQICLCGDGSC